MKQHYKLFELLAHIPPKEMANLRKLVVSPFFVRHQKTKDLFDYLLPFYPHFTSPELSRQSMYEALYPNKPFNSQQLRDVMSFLVEAVEHFLVFSRVQEHPHEYKRLLYAKLATFGMQDSLEKDLQKTKRKLQKEYPQGLNALFQNFETEALLHEINEYGTTNKSLQAKQYVPVFEALMKWLYPKMLEQAVRLYGSNNLYESTMLPQVIALLQQMPFPKDGPVVEIYLKLLALELSSRPEDYTALKDLFLQHQQQLEFDLERICLGRLLHYLYFAATTTPNSILISDDYLLWKQKTLELEIRVNGFLSSAVFYNVAVELIKRNQHANLPEYIKKYAPYLPVQKAQEGVVEYVWAMLYYTTGNFDLCLDYLNRINPKNLDFLRFPYRSLIIMVFFEKKEFDLVSSQLDSFRHYIKDEELAPTVMQMYHNFYRVMVKLVKLMQQTTQTDKQYAKALKLLQYTQALQPRPIMSKALIKKIENLLPDNEK